MNKPIRRLGRGLDSLVSDFIKETAQPEKHPTQSGGQPAMAKTAEAKSASVSQPTSLPIHVIHPNPFQPRKEIDEPGVATLAESIKRNGVLQPVLVRSTSRGFELIAGERRWRAAKLAGVQQLPAVVREATDEQMLEIALIENLHREDLNPIDRALAYRQFCDHFHLKPDEIAERVGEDRTTVLNYMRLLELPVEIQGFVGQGRLSMGHARSLVGMTDEVQRLNLAIRAVRKGLSVRALEAMVRGTKPRPADDSRKRGRSANVRGIERRFEEVVKTRVTINEGRRKGSGRITIEYFSFDDFDRIAELLGVRLEE